MSGTESLFEARLAEHWPFTNWKDVSVLVAVSGGADSVALLLALHALRKKMADAVGRFEVAHFNHRWRGEASDGDEQFVSKLCERLKVPLHVDRAIADNQTGSEASARDERYAFLRRIAEQRGARYLVTAHTADDQAETIMHRILRGTGLRGLRGIQAFRKVSEAVTVVRPILWARRSDVNDYLDRKQQAFRTDSTNSDQKFTRNRIRGDLLPKLAQEYNPSVIESLLRLGKLANESLNELQPLVKNRALLSSIEMDPAAGRDGFKLDLQRLAQESDFMQREILSQLWSEQGWPQKAMSFERWTFVIEALRDRRSQNLPGGVVMRIEADVLTFQIERDSS